MQAPTPGLGPAPGPKQAPPQWRKAMEEVNCQLAAQMAAWMRKRGKSLRPKLSKEQRQQLFECFELMDADGSGAIDASELGAAFKLLGLDVSKGEIEAMLAEVDHDGSGEVEYPEFLEIMTTTLAALEARKIEEGTADSSVPFSLLATAYRRKRIMTGLINGDKEVMVQVVAMAEEAAHKEVEVRASSGGAEGDNPRGSQGGRSTSGGSRSSQAGDCPSSSHSHGGAGGSKRSTAGGAATSTAAPPGAQPHPEQQQQQDPSVMDQQVMDGCGTPPALQRLLRRVKTVNAARWAKGQGSVSTNLNDQLSAEEMEQLTELLRIKARQRMAALSASIKVRGGGGGGAGATSSGCMSAAVSRPGSAPMAPSSTVAGWGWGGEALSGGSSCSSGEGCAQDVLGRPVSCSNSAAHGHGLGAGQGEQQEDGPMATSTGLLSGPGEQQQQRQRGVKWQEGSEAHHSSLHQQQQQEDGTSGSRPGSPSRLGEHSSSWDAAAGASGSGEVPRQLLRGNSRPCSPTALMLLAPLHVPQVHLPFTNASPGSRGRITPTSRPGTGCSRPPHGGSRCSTPAPTPGPGEEASTAPSAPEAAAGQQDGKEAGEMHQQATASSSKGGRSLLADAADGGHTRPASQQHGRTTAAATTSSQQAQAGQPRRQPSRPCPSAAAAAAAAAVVVRQGGREAYCMHTHDMGEGWGSNAQVPARSRSASPPRGNPPQPSTTAAAAAAAGRLRPPELPASMQLRGGGGSIGAAMVGGKARQQQFANLPGVSFKGRGVNLL